MRWSVFLFVIACQQGASQQQPRLDPPVPAPIRAIPIDAADAYSETIDESLRSMATGGAPLHVCFAVSANHRRVACISKIDDPEHDGARNIVILGDVGDARSEWTSDEVAEVRAALAQRKYVAFDPHGIELVTTATVGTFKLRRNIEGIEVACGGRWVDALLDDRLNLHQVAMRVSAFDDHRILVEVEAGWATDGEYASIAVAQLIDTTAVCS